MQNNVFPKDCSRLTFNFVFGNTGKEAMFLIYLWSVIIYTGDKWDKNKNFKADGKLLKEGCLPEWKAGDQPSHSSPPKGSKGTYFREHQSFVSHFLVQTIVPKDTHGVGHPKQNFPQPHNSPEEDTVYIFTTFKCQSLKISGFAYTEEYLTSIGFPCFGVVFLFFLSFF